MYEDHFGLDGRPFQLTPDPRFWFETTTHRKAMAYLGYGLAQGEGFIVITGDIGAGKTTLVGHLMERIDATRLNPIRIVSTQIEAEDLLRVVATGLGVDPAGKSKAELLMLVERGLHAVARTGRRTLLVVDEAQALPVSALEELRMLSNFQAGGHALLQIFLLGQPEFRDRLHGSDRLEQLRQRVIATHHLDPMEADEVEAYIAHRLSLVGWQGRPDFADDAFPALYRASGGVPRRLNQLAGRVLLHCAVEGLELIDAKVVRTVAADGMTEMRVAEVPAAAAAEPAVESTVPSVAEPIEIESSLVEPAPESVATPRPMTHAPVAVAAPRPIRLTAVVDRPVEAPAAPESEAESEAVLQPESETTVELPLAPAIDDRIAMLEARLEAQDAALRRVLTLLVDWVEGEERGGGHGNGRAEVAALRDAAA